MSPVTGQTKNRNTIDGNNHMSPVTGLKKKNRNTIDENDHLSREKQKIKMPFISLNLWRYKDSNLK